MSRMSPHDIVRRAFRQGFEIGCASTTEAVRLRGLLEAERRQADEWFLRAHYTEAEITAMTRAAIDAAFESGAIAWLDESDPSVSWSEARALTARETS